ncbi:MAG: hypothetical protein V4819_22345 [Verrucomicrobiota bacterium]
MSPQQTQLRDLVVELLRAEVVRAEASGGKLGMRDFVLKNLPGIEDGSFFDLPIDFHVSRLFWLNGAYFGRGESAWGLLDGGFLRDDFPKQYDAELRAYADSLGE